MKILSILVLCFMLVHCGDKEKDSKEKTKEAAVAEEGSAEPGEGAAGEGSEADSAEGAKTPAKAPAPSSFNSPELERVQSFSAVYKAQASVYYNNWLGWQGSVPIKILINHSGNDNNKQFIIRIERTQKPAEDEKKAARDTGFFCSLHTELTLDSSILSGSSSIDFENIQSAGQLGNADGIKFQDKFEKEPPFKLTLTHKDKLWSSNKAKNIEKTSQALPSFQALYDSCFGGMTFKGE